MSLVHRDGAGHGYGEKAGVDIEQGNQQFFRLAHQDNILDGLAIADVEQLLAADGISMDELIDAPLDAKPNESGAA
jgi:bifunctional non-homologous end joining protein LigD